MQLPTRHASGCRHLYCCDRIPASRACARVCKGEQLRLHVLTVPWHQLLRCKGVGVF